MASSNVGADSTPLETDRDSSMPGAPYGVSPGPFASSADSGYASASLAPADLADRASTFPFEAAFRAAVVMYHGRGLRNR